MTEFAARLGFGCVKLAAAPSPRQARRLLDLAWSEGGIRYFDTAPLYSRGYSELLLGPFLRGRRDAALVATKCGLAPARPARLPAALALPLQHWRRRLRPAPPPAPPGPGAPPAPRRLDRPELERDFTGSLRRLRVDYLDVYLLHEALPGWLTPRAWDWLRGLRASGRVRRLGIAASHAPSYLELEPAALESWDVLQYDGRSPDGPAIAGRHPRHLHVWHSVLSDLPAARRVFGGSAADAAALLLLGRAAEAPGGRVLFSTADAGHLRANLAALRRLAAAPRLAADYRALRDALSRRQS